MVVVSRWCGEVVKLVFKVLLGSCMVCGGVLMSGEVGFLMELIWWLVERLNYLLVMMLWILV